MVLKLSAGRVGLLTWVLIFAGILGLGLGLVVSRNDVAMGWTIAALSIVAIVIGVSLIWVRSRMEKTSSP